ncbi:PIN domain-containing protein [Bosea sp. (in: a-proteobacteria)]|jgi:predicted nucleic acid-binding protein|uniref:PIN domain-containing protein n=1 Tax=Bosea sp. (in: a-proteobacteria) TaxID=1871050 RepID=UPI0035698660
MRAFSPSPSLVLDTNILVGAILGVRYATVLAHVSRHRALIASMEMARELRLVVARIDERKTERADVLLNAIEVIDQDTYAANLDAARRALRNGPASRNGSTKDAHILALAWTCDADIWSHDRDFAGTGWPSWSSANLAAALDEEASASATKP